MRPFDLTAKFIITAAASLPGYPLRKPEAGTSIGDLDAKNAIALALFVGVVFGAIGLLGFVAATKIDDPEVRDLLRGEHPVTSALVWSPFLSGFAATILSWASSPRSTSRSVRDRRRG